MQYTYANVEPGVSIYDVDSKGELRRVLSVNTDHNEVLVAEHPYRLVGDSFATYTIRFRSISPLCGGGQSPHLFHCYGRLN
jgi:hypothetical protein